MGVKDLSVSSLHPAPHAKTRWTPPFNRIPKWELKFWKVVIFMGIVSTPAYILYNLPNYRAGVGPHVLMLKQQAREAAKNEVSE